jgi:hypothetical protein
LRGIDIVTILMVLVYLAAASLGLSLIALLIATLSPERHWQIVLTVVVVVGLFLCFWMACLIGWELVYRASWITNDRDFWVANAGFLTFYLTMFAVCYCAAVSRLTFASDNRSTAIRIALLVQYLAIIGWFAIGMYNVLDRSFPIEALFAFLSISGVYWYVIGAVTTGESPDISLRVQRSLPETMIGRFFLSWFLPGPGRGYLFAIANFLAGIVLAYGVYVWVYLAEQARGGASPAGFVVLARGQIGTIINDRLIAFSAVFLSYLVIYLGIGKWLLGLMRRRGNPLGLMPTILIHVVLIACGSAIPLMIEGFTSFRHEYTLLQLSNPFWTLGMIANNFGSDRTLAPMFLLPIFAVLVLAFTAPGIAAELRLARIAAPDRILADDAAKIVPKRKKSSPWDDDESA